MNTLKDEHSWPKGVLQEQMYKVLETERSKETQAPFLSWKETRGQEGWSSKVTARCFHISFLFWNLTRLPWGNGTSHIFYLPAFNHFLYSAMNLYLLPKLELFRNSWNPTRNLQNFYSWGEEIGTVMKQCVHCAETKYKTSIRQIDSPWRKIECM